MTSSPRAKRRQAKYLYDAATDLSIGSSLFPPPAAPPREKRTLLEKLDEDVERMARIGENWSKFCGWLTTVQSAAAGMPGANFRWELLAASVCQKCGQVKYAFIPDPYTGNRVMEDHNCGQDSSTPPRNSSQLREKIDPTRLKFELDRHLPGNQKYIVASRVTEEQLSMIPGQQYLERFKLDASLVGCERADELPGCVPRADESVPTTTIRTSASCIIRAIQANIRISNDCSNLAATDDFDWLWGEVNHTPDNVLGWISLTDNDVADFLTKARSSGLICLVENDTVGTNKDKAANGNNPPKPADRVYYFVRIVPPHLIEDRISRQQKTVMIRMVQRMLGPKPGDMIPEDFMLNSQPTEAQIGPSRPSANPSKIGPGNTTGSKEHLAKPEVPGGEDLLRHGSRLSQKRGDVDHSYDPLTPLVPLAGKKVVSLGAIKLILPVDESSGEIGSPQPRVCHFGLCQMVVGGLSNAGYIGLELENDMMRTWRFWGDIESVHELEPEGRNTMPEKGTVQEGSAQFNERRVIKITEYHPRSVSSFIQAEPSFELIKDRRSIDLYDDREGLEVDPVVDMFQCRIESVGADGITFVIYGEGDQFDDMEGPEVYYGVYRLMETDEPVLDYSVMNAAARKKVWQLSKISNCRSDGTFSAIGYALHEVKSRETGSSSSQPKAKDDGVVDLGQIIDDICAAKGIDREEFLRIIEATNSNREVK